MAERIEDKLATLLKITLTDPENFTRIKSLLRRVGINPRGTKNLFQTCHIYRHGNDFYLAHFKELFWLDGRENHMDGMDALRRNRIATILVERGLIVAPNQPLPYNEDALKSVRIAPYADVMNWNLFPKYRFKPSKRIEPTDGNIN